MFWALCLYLMGCSGEDSLPQVEISQLSENGVELR